MLGASSAETAAHSDDVDVISEGIARRLGMNGQLENLLMAARLHDIGKVAVSLRILDKPGPLDLDEWKAIHRHTVIGEEILLAVPELRGAARLVRHSHERWDGTGYPDGLAGEEIPLSSRIIFCADAFHAIRSDRPYRAGRSAADAMAEIRACAGTQFDPLVVEALDALAGELRGATNGHRPRVGRARRLMALMLIVGIGASGSALARSGVFPKAGHAAPGTGAKGSAAPAAFGIAGQPQGSLAIPVGQAAVAPGAAGAAGLGLLSFLPPELTLPSEALGFAALGGLAGAPDGSDSTKDEDSLGVRDHGQGRGRGKGRGHHKAKPAKHGSASSSHRKSSGKGGHSNAHSSSSGKRKLKSSGSGQPSGHSSAGTGRPKGGSSHKSGQVSGAGQTQVATQPKAPKPPKPPKDISAAPQVTDAPPAAGSGNPGAAGNPGGDGHG